MDSGSVSVSAPFDLKGATDSMFADREPGSTRKRE